MDHFKYKEFTKVVKELCIYCLFNADLTYSFSPTYTNMCTHCM